MKYWITVFTIALLITSSFTKKKAKIKAIAPTTEKITYLHVNNWDNYMLPKDVADVALKEILDRTAQYKQLKFCPFGENQCDPEKVGLVEVITRIVNDSMTLFQKDYPNEIKALNALQNIDANGTVPIGNNETVPTDNNETSNKGNVLDLVHRNAYIAPESKVLLLGPNEDEIDNYLHLADHMHNKELHEARDTVQKLYGSSYRNFKVDKKHTHRVRKLPYDPYLVTARRKN